ncbi:hypothetical protein ILUMI_22168 [Ignelater luminosus]|uniref:MULE transposase domain-containing protein n=1 Tax=Ignelater luminosus TaxID=2038154 RepID=A0A8K0CHP5_IGNLU|nr:hypothetical protein ILUMI_22168 [Ignelater luminosus]
MQDGEVIKQLNFHSHDVFAVNVEVATVENPAQVINECLGNLSQACQAPVTSQDFVYVVMAKKLGGVHPVLYALLPNKQRRTYVQMFQAIKGLLPNLNPACITCDIEQAAIAAMSECFPEVTIIECFFHLAKNMKKSLVEMGFTALYNDDPGKFVLVTVS